MAKYNILDEDDVFSEPGKENEQPERQKAKESLEGPEININGEDFFDDSLLVREKRREQEPEERFDAEQEKFPEVTPEDESGGPGHEDDLKEFFRESPSQKPSEERRDTSAAAKKFQGPEQEEVRHIIEEYEDTKIEGLNYKPFVIGAAIILMIVALYFVLDRFVFGGKDTDKSFAEQPPESVQPQISPEQLRKNQMLAQLAGRTDHELSMISDIINLTGKGASLSSMLLYENTFLLEVFAKDRADLAGLQRHLRQDFPGRKFQILTSDIRPGDNGGIFGLYSIEIDGTSSPQDIIRNFTTVQEAKNWLSETTGTAGLKLHTFKEIRSAERDNFRIHEMEIMASGSMESCLAALNKIATARTNMKIHKMNMTSLDQRAFKKSDLQLKIILQVYI